jgi:alpha-ribazole phosphatase
MSKEQRRRSFAPWYRKLGASTRLYLFRHGEVDSVRFPGLYGQLDATLSEEGLKQSQEAAARLDDVELDAVYSSDLERAAYLARLIAESHNLPLETFPEFRERHFGEWQNKTWDEIESEWPDLMRRYLAEYPSFVVPGGENFIAVRDRILSRLDVLLRRHSHGAIALAAHAGCNRVIVADALGLELDKVFNIWQDPACLNIIDYYDDGRALLRLVGG